MNSDQTFSSESQTSNSVQMGPVINAEKYARVLNWTQLT